MSGGAAEGFIVTLKATNATRTTPANKEIQKASKRVNEDTACPKNDRGAELANPGSCLSLSADQSRFTAMISANAPESKSRSTVQTATCDDMLKFCLRAIS